MVGVHRDGRTLETPSPPCRSKQRMIQHSNFPAEIETPGSRQIFFLRSIPHHEEERFSFDPRLAR